MNTKYQPLYNPAQFLEECHYKREGIGEVVSSAVWDVSKHGHRIKGIG